MVQQRQHPYRDHRKSDRAYNQRKGKENDSVLHRIGHDHQRQEQEQARSQSEDFTGNPDDQRADPDDDGNHDPNWQGQKP